MKCTFFGHKNTPESCKDRLRKVIIDIIENNNVDTFYIGNNGNFDALVLRMLKEVASTYTHIKYYVVLAYLPDEKKNSDTFDYKHTIYPEVLEKVPFKFAIDKRNRWMLKQSDIAITYVTTIVGGAYKFKTIAEKQHKIVINIADNTK